MRKPGDSTAVFVAGREGAMAGRVSPPHVSHVTVLSSTIPSLYALRVPRNGEGSRRRRRRDAAELISEIALQKSHFPNSIFFAFDQFVAKIDDWSYGT